MTQALRILVATMTAGLGLSGCMTKPLTWEQVAARSPAPVVLARGETEAVATANVDAADDPAIWRNPADPAASLIIGTDKKAGLYVYGLDGRQRHFVDAGRVNNVDLIETSIAGVPAILVVASDRNDLLAARLALFRLDPATAKLIPLGSVAGGAGEAYGICLIARDGGVDAFSVIKDGTINHIVLDLRGAAPAGRTVRTLKLGTQSEGCVVDPRTSRLYVAEEDIGIWRFDSRPDGPVAPIPVAMVDGKTLFADVEGLALAGTYLVASSQGDNAYALFALTDEKFSGRFRIGHGRFGATSETDGIEVMLGDFGPDYPAGLMVAQDGDNAPNAQNFKLIDWRDVLKAIEAPAP